MINIAEVYGDAQRLQCYACGLPKVHPEFDVEGSYGQKIYNHSCEELMNTMTKDGKVDERFIRTCPDGVKSCFGATGSYDHQDNDPENDICEYIELLFFFFIFCQTLHFYLMKRLGKSTKRSSGYRIQKVQSRALKS